MTLDNHTLQGIKRGIEIGLSDTESAYLWDVNLQEIAQVRAQNQDFLIGSQPAKFTAEEILRGSACEGACT